MDPMIKLTTDVPSNHSNKKLPILDLQVSVNHNENNRMDFEYYEKPTKCKNVILADAALPSKDKRTILTQECLRIIRNTKLELGVDIRNQYLDRFMLKMKNSGYNAKFRKEILDSALKGFDKMIKDDKDDLKPLYRSKNWMKDRRKDQKKERKRNWYKNKGNDKNIKEYESILFVPVTKGGVLAKELKKREEELNKNKKERIKIIESGGIKLKDILIDKNPFKSSKCKESKCFVCQSENSEVPNFSCNTNNCGYRLICNTCKDRNLTKIYEGETSRSARLRGKEHKAGLKNKNTNNVRYKQKLMDHIDEEMEVTMEITKVFKDPLTRQANEAVRISGRNKNEILNSKSQFNHPPVARVVVEGRRNTFRKSYNIKK